MKRYAKFIAAAVAALGVVASSGLLDGQAQAWVNTIFAAAGAAAVYFAPYEPKASAGAHADAQEAE